MFNNPLRKYASGGAAPSQDQQKMLEAFVTWLPKRVKEFANMAPEQIVEALNGMSQSPEGQKQVEQLMQQFKQEMSGTSQFAKGGKLHDFICKHANGGLIKDCGCKEDGGKVEMDENGNRLSRREALAQAQEIYGYDANQARTAYTNAKNALRKSGLRGSALRQAAREMIAKSQAQNNGPVEKIVASIDNTGLSAVPQGLVGAPVVKNNYDNMSFNNAFRAAANIADNGGAKTFNWRGKEYGTRRAVAPISTAFSGGNDKEVDARISDIIKESLTPILVEAPIVKPITASERYPININIPKLTSGLTGSAMMTSAQPNAETYDRVFGVPEAKGRIVRATTFAIPTAPVQPGFQNGLASSTKEPIVIPQTNSVPQDLIYVEKGGKVEKGAKGINNIPTTDRYPGFNIVKDTVFVNPEGKQEKVVILANDLGNAVKQSIVGKDTLSLEGDFLNSKFINLGDQQTNNKDVENKIQELRNKTNAAKKEIGGRFKSPLSAKKSKGAEK